MSAERLREAAALMRSRAAGATHGPWLVGVEMGGSVPQDYIYSAETLTRYPDVDPCVAHVPSGEQVEGMPEGYGINSTAEHIAGWSPEVVDLVALAFDNHADDHDTYDCRWEEPCAHVLAANAYLGASS